MVISRAAVLATLLISQTFAASAAMSGRDSRDRAEGYSGGRGLITYSGQTGMFMNPTSGTANAGDISLQSCALVFDIGGKTVVSHAVLATVGATDWLELGVYGLGVYGVPTGDGRTGSGGDGLPAANRTMGAGQGNVRLRLLKDEGALPEVSIGGMFRAGDAYLRQEQLFVAASKGFDFDLEGVVRGVRFHLGFRQLWQDPDVKERNGSIAYGGIDFSLPYDLHLVGEVSGKDDVYDRTPFSVGIQWRDARGYGASLAFVRSDDWGEDAAYIGIGFNF